jgi:glycosyltransferase involved in cell wall biosynthesis
MSNPASDHRPRVLIFAPVYLPLVGGAEIAIKEITDRLPGWRFDLVCARYRRDLPAVETRGAVTVHRRGLGRPVDRFLLPVLGAAYAWRTWRAADVAVVWAMMASHGGVTAAVYTALRPATRLLLTLQEGAPPPAYVRRVGPLAALHRRVFRRADAVQTISTFLAHWAREVGFEGEPVVVPNGVDFARFAARIAPEKRAEIRRAHGFADGDVVVVTASRLSHKNGVDDLIRALDHLPPHYKLLLLGDGEDRAKLAALAARRPARGRVVFAGSHGHDALPAQLQAGDVFVRASRSEGLGNAFLEAMAVGLPVVGTPVGGIPDFLTDGVTGVFCRPDDPASIARAVLRLQTEPALRDRLVATGAALVRDRYGWDDIARALDRLLTGLRGSEPAAGPVATAASNGASRHAAA